MQYFSLLLLTVQYRLCTYRTTVADASCPVCPSRYSTLHSTHTPKRMLHKQLQHLCAFHLLTPS